MPAPSHVERLHLLALFALVATIYFATFSGVTASNDGSHYALVRALVSQRSFEISPYLAFTENQDFATGPGGRYSDRPPGTAIWAAPFYAAARLLPPPLVEPPSKHDRGNPRLLGIGAAAALAGAGAVALFWLLLRRRFGRSPLRQRPGRARAGASEPRPGSTARSCYSHSLSALLVLLSLYLALRPGPARRAPAGLCCSASLLGGAAWSSSTATPLLVGAGPASAWPRRAAAAPAARRCPRARRLLGGLALPLSLPGASTTRLNFGCPWCVSTFQVDLERWPNAAGMPSAFATPLADGLTGMLWSGRRQPGPVPALAGRLAAPCPGHPGRCSRRSPPEAALVLAIVRRLPAAVRQEHQLNAMTNDGRYLTPFLALWLVPLAFWVDESYLRLTSARRAPGRLAAAVRPALPLGPQPADARRLLLELRPEVPASLLDIEHARAATSPGCSGPSSRTPPTSGGSGSCSLLRPPVARWLSR